MVKEKIYRQVFPMLFFVILVIYCISLLFPLIWMFFSSVRDNMSFVQSPFGWPEEWLFKNYGDAFQYLYVEVGSTGQRVYMIGMFANTIVYAVGCSVVSVLSHCVVAYAVAKYKFRLAKVLYTTAIVTMILPIVGNMPSTLEILRLLGLYDNIWGLILKSGGFTGVAFLIFYGTFKSLSWEYAEAAFIDGASHATVMFRIMIPQTRNVVLVLFLTTFIQHWNDYTTPLLIMPSYPTISFGLYQFMNNNFNAVSDSPHIMAACMIATLPIFLLFLIFKDKMMGNMSIGGLKG